MLPPSHPICIVSTAHTLHTLVSETFLGDFWGKISRNHGSMGIFRFPLGPPTEPLLGSPWGSLGAELSLLAA